MAYEKTNWIDHVVDSETGEIIQQGTRFTAQKMNNIEKGISETRSEVDGLRGLDGKIKVELIPKEGLDVDQVDGLHVDDTNSGSSEEEKNALWSAKKVKEITDELGSQIGQNTHDIAQLSNPNLLINEDFQIWQRGTSFERISNKYTADRWLYDTPGKGSGFNGKIEKTVNGLKLTQLDGLSMSHRFRYLMEVAESLKGKKLTLTLEYKANKVFGVSFLGNDLVTVADSNVNTIKSTGVYGGDLELFSVATYNNADTSMFLELYSVKLELGEIATPLSPRPYGEELALCQRYYEKSYKTEDIVGTSTRASIVFSNAYTTNAIQDIFFKEKKRIAPNIKIWSRNGTLNTISLSGTGADFSLVNPLQANENSFGLSTTTNVTIGTSYNFHYEADAEIY